MKYSARYTDGGYYQVYNSAGEPLLRGEGTRSLQVAFSVANELERGITGSYFLKNGAAL